ncbi:DNA-binding transcriptional MocR family regulator [Pedobacter sp. AK017]|uniref:aminotransferase-like domain-containing protein n=1 Tax=Pedobacter sp. AK017 TaxID=2723073 RepID=UPI00161CE6EF|nr:PLP-dependent aminotransferase family protein [Pedobacter sp. AK017]MBB5438748.1 DNA-binding transcriptional MocR family regulator [Pedobacter sp. AK017]
MSKEVLYLKIAGTVEQQIASETLKVGDKLPSIRTVQKIYNVSLNTVKQAFLELESKSLIESRPKSGYYVSNAYGRRLSIPDTSKPKLYDKEKHPEDLITRVFDTLYYKDITKFSLGVPANGLLPIAKLNKGVIKAMRNLEGSGTAYEPVQGSVNLRRNISRWSFVWAGQLTENDVVTTSGAMNALYNCFIAVTKPGDTIALESPIYFGILQMARELGLKIIELPTHPVTGIEIDALKKILPIIKACCLVSNFNNPLGSCMPDEHKKEVVRLLTQHNIPLIEDDLYGDIFFGTTRPVPCKYYDEAGMVMWCGSFSKSLAPGYRVGWVAPGKFKEKIIRQKLLQTISTPPLYQEVISDFMEHGRYDHHLRTLRHKLYTNCLQYQRAITDYFPENTKVTQPQGGFVLWLELDKRIDTAMLYNQAIKQNISFAPGRMFTQHNQFNNCMRLNFGLKWDEKLESDLKRLGKIVKNAL